MSLRSKLSAVLAACVVTVPLSAVAAQPASASGGSCGSGYNFLSSYPMRYGDAVGGSLDLYYNPSNGYNCAIARAKAAWDGKAHHISVYISDGGRRTVDDPPIGSTANYRYYAGPVKLYLKHKCVYANGNLHYNGDWYRTGDSAFGVHCG